MAQQHTNSICCGTHVSQRHISLSRGASIGASPPLPCDHLVDFAVHSNRHSLSLKSYFKQSNYI